MEGNVQRLHGNAVSCERPLHGGAALYLVHPYFISGRIFDKTRNVA